jgi:hypothetical protein
MPTEAYYFIIAAVLVAVLFAIWKGRGLSLRQNKNGIEIAVKELSQVPPARPHIDVAAGATIEGSRVGDIAGVIVQGGGTAPSVGRDVSVLEQGRIKNSQVGDIAGMKQEEGPKPGV